MRSPRVWQRTETIKHARESGNFSQSELAEYEMRLKNSFVLKDLKNHRKAPDTLSNHRLYDTYPELVCRLCERAYSVNDKPRKKLWRIVRDVARESGSSFWQIAKDVIRVGRTL